MESRKPTFKSVFEGEQARPHLTSKSRSKSRNKKDSMVQVKASNNSKKPSNKTEYVSMIHTDDCNHKSTYDQRIPNFGGNKSSSLTLPVNASTQLQNCRLRMHKLQESFSGMQVSLNSLFDKSFVAGLCNENRNLQNMSDLVISFDERVRKMEDKINRPVTILKSIQHQLIEKVRKAAISDKAIQEKGMKVISSVFHPKISESKAELQLKELEDRLLRLQKLIVDI